MSPTETEYVHHGIRSYVDYGRHWAAQRQWLVSDQAATFWSNFLAVYLTLATARLFPIVKRILVCRWPRVVEDEGELDRLSNHSQQSGHSSPQNQSTQEPSHTETRSTPSTHNVAAAEKFRYSRVKDELERSHSAEGAGLRLLKGVLFRIKPRGVQLSFGGVSPRNYLSDVMNNLRDAFGGHSKSNSRDSSPSNWGEIYSGFWLGLGLLGLYMVFTVLSILSGYVVSDSVAISRSPKCGLFSSPPNGSWRTPEAPLWQKHFHDIRVESWEYAQRCYSGENEYDGCNYFYNRSIHYSVRHNDTCPFKGDLCLEGPTSAFTMSTDMVEAKTVGINTRLKHRFERMTTCAPLRMDYPKFLQFIQPWPAETRWRYYYGTFEGEGVSCTSGTVNCTWEISQNYTFFTPSYQVYTVFKDPSSPNTQGWQPIPELEPMNGSTISLILIRNNGIRYSESREDPIFPTHLALEDGKSYYNTHPHGGVLGCNDKTIVYGPDGTTYQGVWEFGNIPLRDDEASWVSALLYFSLLFSNMFQALQYRSTSALDAQSKLFGANSLPLPREQWKVEAQRLFEASLAMVQITARDIARGPRNIVPGRINLMEQTPIYWGMCNIYKFRSTGWKNINVAGFLGLIGLGLLLMLLSVTREEEELWIEKPLEKVLNTRLVLRVRRGCADVVEKSVAGLRSVRSFLQKLGLFVWKLLKALNQGLWSLRKYLRQWQWRTIRWRHG